MRAERVVADTNGLISAALRPTGRPLAVVDAMRTVNGTLLSSHESFDELRSRLVHPKFDAYFSWESRIVFRTKLATVSEWVSIVGAKLGCRDPDNDKIPETAMMVGADCLITGDRDPLEMSPFCGIPIVAPRDFLDRRTVVSGGDDL